MKLLHPIHRWAALVLLVGAAAGCQPTATEQLQPDPTTGVQADEKVTQLMARAVLPGTQQEYDAITAVYETLTFEQLENFNKLNATKDEERMVQQLAETNAGARVSAQQRATIAAQNQQIADFRTGLNQQSVSRYGVPYNQLTDSTLMTLLDAQTTSVSTIDLNALANPNARLAPQGCSSVSFPYAATKVSNGTQGWSGWTRRSTPNHADDCDYEFRYSGYRYYFDPKDWFADRLCDSFNNRLARRYASPNTYILFGNRGIWLWIGYAGLTSVDMR